MNFKKNIISNYCGHFYSIVINIAIIPLYLQYMGPAAFGLISIYALLQSWLTLINLGLIPALSREVSYCRDQDNGLFKIKQLLRSLEILFFVLLICVIALVSLKSNWIGHDWLKVQNLSYSEVTSSILIMAWIFACRLFSDLYKAGISGVEEQVWLNQMNIFINTLRFAGGYVVVRWISPLPTHFFEYQLCVGLLEPILLGRKCYSILSKPQNISVGIKIAWQTLISLFPLSFGLFYTGLIWILLSQTDRLVLSHVLTLTEYGYFNLVTIVSGGISQFAMPINLALLPRMTHLLSQQKKEEMLQLYRNATQLVCVIMFPLIGVIALFSKAVIFIWTGNIVAANWADSVLRWTVLGNAFLCVSVFQFYLQYVIGNLKWHMVFNTIWVIIVTPCIIYFTYHYGAIGAAYTWFITQGLLFFIWPPIVHRHFAPGIHFKWMLHDIFPILFVAIICILCIDHLHVNFLHDTRLEGFFMLTAFTVSVFLICASASRACREWVLELLDPKRDIIA